MSALYYPTIILLLATVGVFTGRVCARMVKPCWILGYLLPLSVIGIIGLQKHYPWLDFVAPFSWIAGSKTKLLLLAFATPVLLVTPLERVQNRRLKWLGIIFLGAFLLQFCFLPVVLPIFNRAQLLSLKTDVDEDGVCLQRTGYTCGPAAAVTALRRLGLSAEEGSLAVIAGTTQFNGTQPDVLAEALRQHYSTNGLRAEYRAFQSIKELKGIGLTLAVVKYGFMLDHYVTVLEVTDREVIVGDPLEGRVHYSYADFGNRWRYSGVVLSRGISVAE